MEEETGQGSQNKPTLKEISSNRSAPQKANKEAVNQIIC